MSISGFLVELSTLAGISPADFKHSSDPNGSPQPLNHLISAPAAYLDGVVHRWDFLATANYGKTAWNVVLIKEGNQLKCRLENRQTGQNSENNIPIPNPHTADDLIKTLIDRAEPVVEGQGALNFSAVYKEQSLPKEREGQVRRVRLLKGQQDWWWQKWDSLFQMRVYIPFNLTIPSELCTKEARKRIVYLSRTKVSDSIAEVAKYSCINVLNRPIVTLLGNPKLDYPVYRDDKKADISCKAKIQVDSKGKITIQITDRSFKCFPGREEDAVTYKFNAADLTASYVSEEGGATKWIFLDRQTQIPINQRKQANETHWKSVEPIYTARITGGLDDKAFQIELTPRETPLRILPYVHETTCIQTLHKGMETYVTDSYDCEVLPRFELSFPAEPRLQLPRQEFTCLELEPTFASSCFDETVPITHFQWGFTLLASGGTEEYKLSKHLPKIEAPNFLKNNHAVGALELINDGFFQNIGLHQPVRILFHYTGEEIKVKQVQEFRWSERSKVFPVDPENGKKLYEALMKAIQSRPYYDVRGGDAVFSAGHSCITWLREYLKIVNVDLGVNFGGWIGTRTKNWTKEMHLSQNGSL